MDIVQIRTKVIGWYGMELRNTGTDTMEQYYPQRR